MPYVVTTKRQYVDVEDGIERQRPEVISRLAVATLEDARATAGLAVGRSGGKSSDWAVHYAAAAALPESGGTVGPLPDGTVIEVSQVGWSDLRVEAGIARPALSSVILAAFNAKAAQR